MLGATPFPFQKDERNVPSLQIACGQITWRRGEFTQDEILAQIAQAGYDGAPASAPSLAEVPETLALFNRHALKPAPGYLGAQLWEPAEADATVARASQMAQIAAAFGLTELYVAANLTPERRAVAGHVSPSDALDDAGYATMASTLDRIGSATLEHGVRASFHNHVGSFIETREEIDELFARVDRELVSQGPDLGHLAWAGGDAVSFVRDYASDITTLHIKDIDPDVLATGVQAGWDYGQFSDAGIFTELGQGFVDFPAVFSELNQAGFAGWVVVETDVTQRPSALESATISRNYLRSLGM
jgi:inosose dehydratase